MENKKTDICCRQSFNACACVVTPPPAKDGPAQESVKIVMPLNQYSQRMQ